MGLTRMVPSWKMASMAVLCAALFTAACTPKKTVKKGSGQEGLEGADSSGALGVLGPGVDADEASLRGRQFVETADLQAIYFDYDQYALSDAARAALQSNAAYLKDHPDLDALVEGHCDERGTIEYNLALGQKRASSVRDYYIRLGVPGKSLATLSFGEERPVCGERSEDCWGKSRRAVSKIRAQVSSMPGPGENRDAQ